MHICLFDIDGTLIASGGAGRAALEAALADEFGNFFCRFQERHRFIS